MVSTKGPTLYDLGLIPALGKDMGQLFLWLEQSELTRKGQSYQKNLFDQPPEYGQAYNEDSLAVIAAPTQRARKLTRDEIKALKNEYQSNDNMTGLNGVDKNSLWQTIRSRNSNVRELDFERLPADFIAFYRPFHYPPYDQWGIYLMIEPLLRYHNNLIKIAFKTKLFSAETLMHLVLFEIFHHEFFHHLTESAATTLEIISAAMGDPKPIYIEYKIRQHNQLIDYPHAPLEEALANAYAWNSLGFISRVKAGYKTGIVNFYQKAIEKHWKLEPEGYRDAAFYIKANHIPGGAHLLAQLIGKSKADCSAPLIKLSQSVMPSGFSAFAAKPDIPTWLVGSLEALEAFYKLVPAPNEAYTQLFWPYDTSELDQYIQQKKKEDKKQREKAKKQKIPVSTTSEQRPTVLIVDDDSTVIDVLQEYFIGEGFQSLKALSAEEAIPILQDNNIDVVLTDVIMAGMSGLELTKIIKKEYDSAVIIFTGYEKNCNFEQAIKLGASDFFYKPIRLEEILLRVKRVLRERNKNHLDVH